MKKFASSIKSTTAVCTGVLRAALGNHGYDVSENGSFLEAYDGERALAILPVSRCLSDKKYLETTTIAASVAGVKKLLEQYSVPNPLEVIQQRDVSALDVIVGNANVPGTLCIAYGICKYGYHNIEVAVIPVSTFFQKAVTGSVFSIAAKSGDFFYDFSKVAAGNTDGILLRSRFVVQNDD